MGFELSGFGFKGQQPEAINHPTSGPPALSLGQLQVWGSPHCHTLWRPRENTRWTGVTSWVRSPPFSAEELEDLVLSMEALENRGYRDAYQLGRDTA